MSDGQGGGEGGQSGGQGAGDGQGNGGALAGALAGAGGQGGGEGGGQGGGDGQQQQQQDRWQDKFLPDELKADETLALYKDIPSVAKALVETKAWARGRIAIPAADATPEQLAEFNAKVRPADAKDYDLGVKEGETSDFAEAVRPVLFELGVPAHAAKGLATWWNQYQADAASKLTTAGKDALTGIEVELGTPAYTQRLQAVDNMFQRMGFDVGEVSTSLESAYGADKAMRFLMKVAESTGELEKVDGDTVNLRMGNLTAAQAQQKLDQMQRDPEMRKKYTVKDSPEHKLRQSLIARIAKGD